jgi:hypothetical protein
LGGPIFGLKTPKKERAKYMARKHFTPEQIIKKLREAEVLQNIVVLSSL